MILHSKEDCESELLSPPSHGWLATKSDKITSVAALPTLLVFDFRRLRISPSAAGDEDELLLVFLDAVQLVVTASEHVKVW